mmetsp:Transcript_76770/g.237794  ORF Transcript_76770/g.237794 Transcript_76770/m.237794 type:complete len:251 (+) Transcript_76770:49-801(+)
MRAVPESRRTQGRPLPPPPPPPDMGLSGPSGSGKRTLDGSLCRRRGKQARTHAMKARLRRASMLEAARSGLRSDSSALPASTAASQGSRAPTPRPKSLAKKLRDNRSRKWSSVLRDTRMKRAWNRTPEPMPETKRAIRSTVCCTHNAWVFSSQKTTRAWATNSAPANSSIPEMWSARETAILDKHSEAGIGRYTPPRSKPAKATAGSDVRRLLFRQAKAADSSAVKFAEKRKNAARQIRSTCWGGRMDSP